MSYVSPAASREATTAVKPISPKREFEKLIRDIRAIAANTRAFSGNLVQELIKETESSAETQRNWSWAGSAGQLGSPLIALVVAMVYKKEIIETVGIGAKIGDAIQSVFGVSQLGYKANEQKIQQSLSHYNSFESRMQSLIQSIDSAQQRLQQKEMEEASNR